MPERLQMAARISRAVALQGKRISDVDLSIFQDDDSVPSKTLYLQLMTSLVVRKLNFINFENQTELMLNKQFPTHCMTILEKTKQNSRKELHLSFPLILFYIFCKHNGRGEAKGVGRQGF